jgi:hypothetical protein
MDARINIITCDVGSWDFLIIARLWLGIQNQVRFAIACCARGARVLCRYTKSSLDETMMQDIRLLMVR